MRKINVNVTHRLTIEIDDSFVVDGEDDDLESFINELNVDWEENWEGGKIVDDEMVEYELESEDICS